VNIAEKFLSGGGLRKMVLSDDEQKQLLGAVARHLRVLQEIPDFLPHLRVDADAVEVRSSKVCDGRGVFATRAIPAHTLVTLYPATNEVSLCANRRERRDARLARGRLRKTGTFLRHVQRQRVLRRRLFTNRSQLLLIQRSRRGFWGIS
jgi:hypothetical protein